MEITLDLDECVGCGNCTTACPLGLVEVSRGKVSIKEGCNLCGDCAAACGYYVIKIENDREVNKTGAIWESR
jgi:Fe-S-cluster-containing hydrogenase component 2